MQVYFIDSEDYFKGRQVESDKNDKLYKDNDERSIFFAKGVIETIKKLNWAQFNFLIVSITPLAKKIDLSSLSLYSLSFLSDSTCLPLK